MIFRGSMYAVTSCHCQIDISEPVTNYELVSCRAFIPNQCFVLIGCNCIDI